MDRVLIDVSGDLKVCRLGCSFTELECYITKCLCFCCVSQMDFTLLLLIYSKSGARNELGRLFQLCFRKSCMVELRSLLLEH